MKKCTYRHRPGVVSFGLVVLLFCFGAVVFGINSAQFVEKAAPLFSKFGGKGKGDFLPIFITARNIHPAGFEVLNGGGRLLQCVPPLVLRRGAVEALSGAFAVPLVLARR